MSNEKGGKSIMNEKDLLNVIQESQWEISKEELVKGISVLKKSKEFQELQVLLLMEKVLKLVLGKESKELLQLQAVVEIIKMIENIADWNLEEMEMEKQINWLKKVLSKMATLNPNFNFDTLFSVYVRKEYGLPIVTMDFEFFKIIQTIQVGHACTQSFVIMKSLEELSQMGVSADEKDVIKKTVSKKNAIYRLMNKLRSHGWEMELDTLLEDFEGPYSSSEILEELENSEITISEYEQMYQSSREAFKDIILPLFDNQQDALELENEIENREPSTYEMQNLEDTRNITEGIKKPKTR